MKPENWLCQYHDEWIEGNEQRLAAGLRIHLKRCPTCGQELVDQFVLTLQKSFDEVPSSHDQ